MSMLDREFSKDTFIDIDEYNECYYFSKRNPCYRSIRDSIIKHLFAEGIKSLNDDITKQNNLIFCLLCHVPFLISNQLPFLN